MTQNSQLSALEPREVFAHFEALTRIPRPSGGVAAVREHITAWAKARGFDTRVDAVGNLRVRVPATPGHEGAPIVILQGHMDMVTEKDPAFDFDFDKQPIPFRVDGDWIIADKTTLGADNGIGVAAALASADDPSVVHGPLEILLTVEEETALVGASGLDASLVEGRTLINIDSEEDYSLFVGCAGGCTTEIAFPALREAAPAGFTALRLQVGGLKGGHSGLVIHENRANAMKVFGRVLGRWLEHAPVRLASLDAGNKHNAIPRDAVAVVYAPTAFAADAATHAAAVAAEMLTEFRTIDPELAVTVGPGSSELAPLSEEATRRFALLLAGVPHGALTMSRDIPGLTETSCNLAIARTSEAQLLVTMSSRSSVAAALKGTLAQIAAVARLSGAAVRELSGYPGWQPNMSSKLLEICRGLYRELRGKDANVTAIHAGLECGIIGERIGGAVDMISYGPDMHGVHAPGERLCISSVGRFWAFHKSVLARLA